MFIVNVPPQQPVKVLFTLNIIFSRRLDPDQQLELVTNIKREIERERERERVCERGREREGREDGYLRTGDGYKRKLTINRATFYHKGKNAPKSL